MKKSIRFLSFFLIIIILSLSLFSCGARPLAQSKLAGTKVGKVGSHDVYYEELYCLANGYLPVAKANRGDDSSAIKDAVWDYVKENIPINYAILDLCASEGIEYNEKALQDEINNAIEVEIEASFDGDRDAYLNSQLEEGITDHYYRFCLGIDAIYKKLAEKYQEEGKIPTSDEDVIKYIKENFVHTWHIAVYVDKNDDRDTEYAKILEAKRLLDSGNSMYKLFGSAYNENIAYESLVNTDGYYFPKGIMEKDYEAAAFSLKNNGDRTDIITSRAKSPTSGSYVECFYIIEKLPIKDTEINDNFNYLSDMIRETVVTDGLNDHLEKLSFEPNEYALSLDLTALEAPTNGADYQVIIIVTASIASIALIICGIFIFRHVRAKRFKKALTENNKKSIDKKH